MPASNILRIFAGISKLLISSSALLNLYSLSCDSFSSFYLAFQHEIEKGAVYVSMDFSKEVAILSGSFSLCLPLKQLH
jgi:hypothetical protein